LSRKKSESARNWRNPLFVADPQLRKVADSLLLGRQLRRAVRSGLALGTFVIEQPTPACIAAMRLAGFDFVVLDMEHSAIDFGSLEHLIQAAHAVGMPTLVRTWGEDTGLIGKVLDMGASGIMAPHIDTAERARQIVRQARFAPHGQRGFSPLTRFDALRTPLRSLSAATYVVVQIEGRKALENVAEIAAVPGIDTVFVGPYDLALSLNLPPGSPRVVAAAARVSGAVESAVSMGIYIDDPATCGDWAKRGFVLQCVSFDGRMLAEGARAVAAQARNSVPRRRSLS
jgi:2-keto-3-deoxy-L-rhamnonate aldolase RhmA